MTNPALFNIVAAAVMGVLGVGALLCAPAAAHDVCLAVVSGLTGALVGGAAQLKPKPETEPEA